MSLRDEIAAVFKELENGHCLKQDGSYPCGQDTNLTCDLCGSDQSLVLIADKVRGLETPPEYKAWPSWGVWRDAIQAVLDMLEVKGED